MVHNDCPKPMEIVVIDLTEMNRIIAPQGKVYLWNIVDASSNFGWSKVIYDKTSDSVLESWMIMRNTLEGKKV
jgi:hypothetical protein